MEYERIHKVQTGIISPSKLRMKLMGPHHQRKKEGSNCNSSRTSPSKLEDFEFVKNSLLAAQNDDFEDEASGLEVPSAPLSANTGSAQSEVNSCQPKKLLARENANGGSSKMHQFSKVDVCNSSTVHPVRMFEDENLDYDSTSSFEFHKGERSLYHKAGRSLGRPMSSKWNDAEKWIMNRQNLQANYSKKVHFQNQLNRMPQKNMVRIAPESAAHEDKLSVKRVDFSQPLQQTGLEKFDFVPTAPHQISGQGSVGTMSVGLCSESKDLMEVDNRDFSCAESSIEDTTAIISVSMRDMGTEMTPIPSQDPSTTTTPIGATTPLRSPSTSIPSTPRREEPVPTPNDNSINVALPHSPENERNKLSEEDLKLKTRKEILALGVQLGKMNIAAWASKDDKNKNDSVGPKVDMDELEQIEFAKRAAAWEEVEKSKHAARFKREEIRIQAWESQQKAKLEAEMRKIEAQVEQMRAQAHAKMVKKIAMARQKSEEKRAVAEARRNRQAVKTAGQAEYIRETGRIPSTQFLCCSWS